MEPDCRTIQGFERLVMRMFVFNGFPFADRLGEGHSKDNCPIFLQFLDCVSQLISQQPISFEFTFKYLSQLARLMQSNIYGTFASNSPREYLES